MTQKKTVTKKKAAKTKALEKETDFKALEKLVKNTSHSAKPKQLLKDLDKAFKAHDNAKTKTQKEDTKLALNKAYNDAAYAYALDNHVAACNTVSETYQGLVVSMSDDLVAEFDCTAPHEKALAEMIASSYARYIQYTTLFRNTQNIDYLSSEKTSFYSMYSKEADKAHRQFTTALSTLKQLKTPAPMVSVNAKNAFVAQNQQLNAYKDKEQGEIING